MPKITKTFIEIEITMPASGQTIYRDDELIGFAVRATRRTKAFIVEKRVNGVNRRITLGKYGVLGLAEAKSQARTMLSEMEKGKDPGRGGSKRFTDTVTLREVFNKYLAVKKLRRETQKLYTFSIETCLSAWLDMPIAAITKDMVEERHRELSQMQTRLGTPGHARADNAMKSLRTLIFFAADRYNTNEESLIKINPVDRLTRNKAWHRHPPRQGIIPDQKLRDWYRAIATAHNEVIRDYFLFVLLTGMRRMESMSLQWSHVDFEREILTVPRELTKSDREHRLPLSRFLVELLKSRYKKRVHSDWVFQSAKDSTKHISEMFFAFPELRKRCGLHFQIHDLRRTFLTMAEKLEVPQYALKKLVNHKVDKDVTGRYIILDIDHLRPYMERITEKFVELMGANANDLDEWRRIEKSDLEDGVQLQLKIADSDTEL